MTASQSSSRKWAVATFFVGSLIAYPFLRKPPDQVSPEAVSSRNPETASISRTSTFPHAFPPSHSESSASKAGFSPGSVRATQASSRSLAIVGGQSRSLTDDELLENASPESRGMIELPAWAPPVSSLDRLIAQGPAPQADEKVPRELGEIPTWINQPFNPTAQLQPNNDSPDDRTRQRTYPPDQNLDLGLPPKQSSLASIRASPWDVPSGSNRLSESPQPTSNLAWPEKQGAFAFEEPAQTDWEKTQVNPRAVLTTGETMRREPAATGWYQDNNFNSDPTQSVDTPWGGLTHAHGTGQPVADRQRRFVYQPGFEPDG